jgi:Tfp pilus assembly protein PilN
VSTQTVQTAGLAVMPRVNLMPPEIAEAARFRRLQFAMGGAVLAAVVIVGALYTQAKHSVTAAQSQVDAAQSQQTVLQSKLTSLDSVKQTLADVQAKRGLLQQAMGSEIRWSYMLNDLSFRIPNNVWLTGITASETAGSTAAATPAGATGSDIGNISFSGVAFKHDDVATWLDALAKEKGFSQPSFSSSSEAAIGTRSVVNFGSSVNLDNSALSNRYVQKAGN